MVLPIVSEREGTDKSGAETVKKLLAISHSAMQSYILKIHYFEEDPYSNHRAGKSGPPACRGAAELS